MERPLIISVGRECGSGGREIANDLAKRFNLPLYDSNILEHVAEEKDIDSTELKKYDEKPKIRLFSRTVKGYTNSMHENIANLQFEFLQKKAEAGESFVIVGRCAETKLKGYEGLVSIFVLGDKETKLARIKRICNADDDEARYIIERTDWQRKSYHNYYCKGKWGDSRNYDLSINSSKLGIVKTADILESYIRERMQSK